MYRIIKAVKSSELIHDFDKISAASEMTCIVSSGALNSTHSLTLHI